MIARFAVLGVTTVAMTAKVVRSAPISLESVQRRLELLYYADPGLFPWIDSPTLTK